jgi:hypothetical protein
MAIFGLIEERRMYKHPSLMPLFVSETFKFGWMDEKKSGHRSMYFNTDGC